MSTLVTVGNAHQPFSRLMNVISDAVEDLPQPIYVQHGHTPFYREGIIATPFMEMDVFDRAIANADIIICHAGAGTLIRAIRAGKRPLVMPRQQRFGEHIDDHQEEIAQAFASKEKVLLFSDIRGLRGAIRLAQASGGLAASGPAISAMSSVLAEHLRDYANRLSFNK